MTVREVYLLRHAKSSWNDPGVDDHDRPLNARGRRSAVEVARTLTERTIRPDLVLVSSAARTVETVNALRLDTQISVEPRLYAATSDQLLSRLRVLPDEVTIALLVGHNPGIEQLAAVLSRIEDKPLEGMQTATLVGLSVNIDRWSFLAEHSAAAIGRWRHRGEKRR